MRCVVFLVLGVLVFWVVFMRVKLLWLCVLIDYFMGFCRVFFVGCVYGLVVIIMNDLVVLMVVYFVVNLVVVYVWWIELNNDMKI